jgi:hypothetical protein
LHCTISLLNYATIFLIMQLWNQVIFQQHRSSKLGEWGMVQSIWEVLDCCWDSYTLTSEIHSENLQKYSECFRMLPKRFHVTTTVYTLAHPIKFSDRFCNVTQIKGGGIGRMYSIRERGKKCIRN